MAVGVVFGFEGAGPEGAVRYVVEGCVAVVAGCAAEGFERGLHCFGGFSIKIRFDRGRGSDRYVQTVPVRPMPNARTCIGTVRGAFSLSETKLVMLAFVVQDGDGVCVI